MPRSMSSAMLSAISASEILPALFVTATFKTGPIYVWSGYGSITWGGNTWLGIGTLGSVSVIEDASTVEAKGVTLTMSGIDPTLLNLALTEFQLGAPAAVYLGMFSTSNTLLATPIPAWAGRMDQPTVDVSAETAVISINCESRLIEMNRSVSRRYTADDQQRDYPGDLGMSAVASIQQATIFWGRVPSPDSNQQT